MSRAKLSDRIDDLFQRCAWEEARKLLEKERQKHPDSHWVLTQLGVELDKTRREILKELDPNFDESDADT